LQIGEPYTVYRSLLNRTDDDTMNTTKSKPEIAELGPSIRRSVHVCIESFPLVKECRWMRGRRWRADCGSSRERFRASQPQQFEVAIRST